MRGTVAVSFNKASAAASIIVHEIVVVTSLSEGIESSCSASVTDRRIWNGIAGPVCLYSASGRAAISSNVISIITSLTISSCCDSISTSIADRRVVSWASGVSLNCACR